MCVQCLVMYIQSVVSMFIAMWVCAGICAGHLSLYALACDKGSLFLSLIQIKKKKHEDHEEVNQADSLILFAAQTLCTFNHMFFFRLHASGVPRAVYLHFLHIISFSLTALIYYCRLRCSVSSCRREHTNFCMSKN